MKFKIIIPARYGAKRLPGKLLIKIAGKTILQHVYQRAKESDADEIIIATDDKRIADVAASFGADICMTRITHHSGTERLAEVATIRQFSDTDLIVNVQGDEPCLPATLINQVAEDLAAHPEADMATLCSHLGTEESAFDPDIVKVVMDKNGYALYFSRSPVPWIKKERYNQKLAVENLPYYRHIGVYAYQTIFLKQYSLLQPCQLEQQESLEQLRALFHSRRIHISLAHINPGHGIDTEQDLPKAEEILKRL